MIAGELILRGYESNLLVLLSWAGQVTATLAGLLLVSYTGVLFGVTAVPVWSENRTLLPPQFVASGLGSAAGVLELLGFLSPATQVMGFIAAGAETLIGTLIEVRRRPVDEPLQSGKTGRAMLAAGVLAGPVSLLIRALWGSHPIGRNAAAVCFIAGALTIRYAWLAAGRTSSRNPQALFEIQSKSVES